jgi:hypothetical protein
MIFGSDNFDGMADDFYRCTEVSTFIEHAEPKDDAYKIVTAMVRKLEKIGTISAADMKRFLRK